MANTIRIQSKITINVTSGLQFQDVTNPDAHVPDRLKINPEWPKKTVLIKEGVGDYPAEIATWPTVKSLVKDNVITISGESPVLTTPPTDVEDIPEETPKKTTKKKTLAEAIGE